MKLSNALLILGWIAVIIEIVGPKESVQPFESVAIILFCYSIFIRAFGELEPTKKRDEE